MDESVGGRLRGCSLLFGGGGRERRGGGGGGGRARLGEGLGLCRRNRLWGLGWRGLSVGPGELLAGSLGEEKRLRWG